MRGDMRTLSGSYGALNAHDGLWNSASETSYSLEARLVIEHCVHEARGLDVLPATIGKFRKNGGETKRFFCSHHSTRGMFYVCTSFCLTCRYTSVKMYSLKSIERE